MHELETHVRAALNPSHSWLDAIEPDWEAIVASAELDLTEKPSGNRILATVARKRLLAGAAALAVILIAAVVPTTLLPDDRLGASPAAAEVLKTTAAAAAYQSTSPPGAYQYEKVHVLEAGIGYPIPEPTMVQKPSTRETWIASDGSGHLRESTEDLRFLSERDRSRWLRANPGYQRTPTRQEDFDARDDLRDAASYPTDVDQLKKRLEEKAKELDTALEPAMLSLISDLLTSPAATPDLRASLFRVLSETDRVELVGQLTDSIGRKGVAISVPAGSPHDNPLANGVLIFDDRTGAVLEFRTVLIRPVPWTAANPPVTISRTTYLASGWTDTIGEEP